MAVHQLEEEHQEEIPTHQQTREWVNSHLGKVIKNHMLIRLGHEGMMLDKILKQNRIVRDGVRAFQRGETPMANDAAEDEDDMGVSIGNENHYHITQLPEPAATPVEPVAPVTAATPVAVTTAEPSMLQRLGVPALVAATAIGGTTLGYWLSRPDKPTPTPSTTNIYQPGDSLDVQLKLPPPSKP